MGERTCSVDGCERPVRTRGWCDAHYQRWWKTGDTGESELRRVIVGTPEERFWPKVTPTGFCWEWNAGRFPSGYGKFQLNGEAVGAHRWAYEHLIGPIPDGLCIDHLCRNRACVNPDHLELVTLGENSRRGTVLRHLQARSNRVA